MLFTISLKEIHDHLKSPVFLLGALIVVFLTAYATMIGANDYRQRRDDCLAARVSFGKKQLTYYMFREPNPMSIFAQGYDTRAGTTVIVRRDRIPVNTGGYMDIAGNSQSNRYDTGLLSIDYAFVVRMVLSIFVIFLVFDVIAGERRRGTLKLMLANSVPRDTVLLGKMLGGWVMIIALLTVASVVSLALVFVNQGIQASSDMALRFFGIYAASVLYLTVFFALGLWISVVVNRSSTVLMTLLVVWVAITAVYPNLGCLIAQRLVRIPGEEELWNTPSLQDAMRQFNDEFGREVQASVESRNKSRSDQLRHLASADRIREREARLIYNVERARVDALDRQASLASMLTMASPAAIYDQAVILIAGTSSDDYDRFFEYVRHTWEIISRANQIKFQDRTASGKILESIEPFHPGGVRSNLPKAMYFLGILGILSILFFALAYTGFLRKDIR